MPAKPRSTSSSTVASSSRARIARVRSACGTRVAAVEDAEGEVTDARLPSDKQTVKPDFLCRVG